MKTVFTNGCFDVLHRGHIELFRFCSTLGDRVIVGLNSDESAKSIKGNDRPINNEKDRAALVEAIRFVDQVVIFEEDTPHSIIKTLNPDIIVKGGDYDADLVVGKDLAEVVIFDYIDGYSTTRTLQALSNR